MSQASVETIDVIESDRLNSEFSFSRCAGLGVGSQKHSFPPGNRFCLPTTSLKLFIKGFLALMEILRYSTEVVSSNTWLL